MTKAEKKSGELLKKITDLVREYKKVVDGFPDKVSLESNRALVIGTWSSIDGACISAKIGHSVLCDGLVKQLDREPKSSFAEMMGL